MTKNIKTDGMKKLSEIEIGKTFRGADGIERILLDLLPNGTALTLTRDFVFENEIFDGNSNNYDKSSIRTKLEAMVPDLEKSFGAENLVEFEIDLTSDDGLDTYGKIKTKYGLLTAEQYRKYTRIISKYAVTDWWWLATADSTTERNINYWVRCVAGGGRVSIYSCSNYFGVRAVCIFKSDIFVSE